MVSASSSARFPTLAALGLVTLALAGCVEANPAPTPTGGVETPSATPSIPPTNPATEPQGAVDIACADLVDPDAVYAFDPNFALVGSFEPAAGSAAARALEEDGVLCRWVRESGGMTIDLSAARPSDDDLAVLRTEASASGAAVPAYGDEAYFDASTGTATVFQGPYWVVITSVAFAEPAEPADILDSSLAALSALP